MALQENVSQVTPTAEPLKRTFQEVLGCTSKVVPAARFPRNGPKIVAYMNQCEPLGSLKDSKPGLGFRVRGFRVQGPGV